MPMEKVDQDLIEEMMPENQRLKELYEEHVKLDKETEHLEKLRGYSTSAALALAALKKKKLSGMDEMMSILSEHREESFKDTAMM
jgi:uncharacterized protein YdcH (DUF465 family)